MAEVHRALDTRSGRIVALKTVLPAIAEDEDFVQMFLDEARIASELEHPHIARLLDFGELDEDGQYFIAYELVDGRDLRFVFENASLGGERLPLSVLLYVFTRIAEALSYAHARKDRQHFPKAIVHRDVSPQNIVVSYAGDVKLIDFGIAKARGRLTRTGAGTIKGKFGYMSPEQVRGEPVDQTTDVFSLGICMWELLTLKRLFTGQNEILVLDMVKRHVPDPPSAFNAELANLVPDGLRAELDQIVMKSLAKSPDERYKSARELYKELYAFVEKTELMASRDDVARTMRQAFGVSPGDLSGQNPAVELRSSQEGSMRESKWRARTPYSRSTGRIMELQETRMSDDKKGGSDLDIFEGLGKKTLSEVKPADSSKTPPPPPGSASHLAAAQKAGLDAKKTLMGIADPANAREVTAGVPPAPPTNPSLPSNINQGPSSSRPQAPGGHASGQMRAAPVSTPSPSKPPPPPGRGSLPNMASPVAHTLSPAAAGSEPPRSQPPPLPPEARGSNPPATSPSATQKVSSNVPPPASTRPGPAGLNTRNSQSAPTQEVAAPATKPNGGKLDMDWDDDDEATHVFDKEAKDAEKVAAAPSTETLRGPDSREPERASMDAIMSSPPRELAKQVPSAPPAAGTPPPPVGSTTATLSGAFGALGQKANGSSPPSASFKSGPPPSQSLRAAPPPPPGSMRNPSTTTAPIPPPPPPGQTTTAPMHMPPSAHAQQRPASVPPQGHHPSGHPSGHHSVPPHSAHGSHHPQAHSQPPVQMPPVSRNMEATAMVPRPQPASKAPLIIGLLLAVMALAGIGVFFVMPKFTPATVVINVADSKGGSPKNLEVLVDGAKKCDSTPCVVPNVTPGVHEVKVVAQGYDPQVRALNLEGKNIQSDFTLVGGKAGGTGFKVTSTQTGVKVSVDNKEIGTLPQEVKDLEAGEHKLHFVGSSDRYAPLDKTISVAKDEIVDLGNVSLKVVKGKATIMLGTPGAKVYLVQGTNRKEVPQFPMAIEFDPNEKWELQGTKEGFDEFKQPISFEDGNAEKTFTVTLSPKGSAVAANPPVVAQPPVVAHNTPAVHTQPKVAPEPKEAPAPKEPVAKAEPKEPAAKTEPAAKKEPAAAGAGGEAFLNINSLPASTVVLDGKPLGPTPRVKVSVTPGQHTILFVNAEQSLKKTITVSVGAGETKAAFAKLRD